MKQIIFCVLMITGINLARAQEEQKHSFYFSEELGYGNYLGIDLNINYLYLEKYSFKMGYSGNLRQPKSQPYNYSPGFFGVLFMGLANPFDQLENYQLAAGRIYDLNKKGTIRMNLSLGIGYTTIREPGNWQSTGSHLLQENYTWDYEKYHTLSLIINPKIEFPLSRFYGLTVSPMVQLSKDRIYFGIGLGQIIGLLRSKKKPDPAEI